MFNITFFKPDSSSNRFDNLRATPYLESFFIIQKIRILLKTNKRANTESGYRRSDGGQFIDIF